MKRRTGGRPRCTAPPSPCAPLINNHAFLDGNKRIGILVMLTFLEMNGFMPDCTDDELIQLGLRLAAGKIDDRQLLDWIIDHV